MGYDKLLGVGEEVGELMHHHLKQLQGIRGSTETHIAKRKDAIGDIVVYLANYCSANGFSFGSIVADVWSDVSRRDWVADKLRGISATPSISDES